jgi:hypothetical protein
MNYITISAINTAITPIFHGGNEKTGSSPILRTIYIWTKDGEQPIPYLHGNALRGKLRRTLMKDMIDLVEFNITNKKLYHSIFSGGVLESTEETTGVLDLTLRKKIMSLLPPVALFGCGIGNQLIQGKLVVGHMFPLCEEYAPYLPEGIRDARTEKPVRIFTDSSFITRRDDLREERKEDEQAVQMKVDYECFIPGTAFWHEFKLMWSNDLENSCFARMIELWKEHSIIGGRSASGDGKLRLGYDIKFDQKAYLDFLSEKKKEINEFLGELNGMV